MSLQETHVFFYDELTDNVFARFFLWTVYPLLCIIFSVSVVQVSHLDIKSEILSYSH